MKIALRGGFATAAVVLPLACFAGSDYAAWSKVNTDGSWTRIAERIVQHSSLPDSRPSDVGKFCPAYEQLNSADRTRFWVSLLSAMARFESNFNPETTFKESFKDRAGHNVISRGLLQLSFESASARPYGCTIAQEQDLHDPSTNLTCAARILALWVRRDGVIATYRADRAPRGGGRYWSVLRQRNGHLPEISGFTSKDLAVCDNAPPKPKSNTGAR